MWVQVIEGKAKDEAGLRKQFERWNEEIRPNVKGFLGSTSGVTEDGKFFTVARFESVDLAMENSNDPKQTEWWNETVQYLDGEPTFRDCSEVDLMRDGGSNDAGFVQIMQSGLTNYERAREVGTRMSEAMPSDMRPEFIGGVIAWDGEVLTQAAYFTSEEEARKGEKQDMGEFASKHPEAAQLFEEMGKLQTDMKYFDLRDPWIV